MDTISGVTRDKSITENEFLVITSFNKLGKVSQIYKERWQIKMLFKSIKSSGFDIEKTHLTDIERIERLLLPVMIAFLWCYKVGIPLNLTRPIEIKKHRRKANSIFKYGLRIYIIKYVQHV